MSQTATTPRLRIGPTPEGYESGPVTVLFKPSDDLPTDELKTCADLDDALAFAERCRDGGVLSGELEFQIAQNGPSALQAIVDEEQAAHDADAPTSPEPAPAPAPAKPKRGRKPKASKELEPTHAVVYVSKTGVETVDYEGPETEARKKFAGIPTPGVGRLELRDAQAAVLDTKAPHLASVPEKGGIAGPIGDQPAIGDDDEPEMDEPLPEEDVVGGDDAGSPAPPEGPEEPTGQKTLIDRSEYQREDLALPMIDGQQIDRIAFAFTGQIMLDRGDPADVALWRKLVLGQDVTLQVEGVCAGYSGKGATNRDGDLDVVVGVRRIKVHSIYLPVETDKAA